MYKYDHIDQTLVNQRVAQFRDQVARRLDGSLAEEEFRPLRLQNGLYHQRHAYMLRVAIPYGLFNSKQLRTMALIAEKYDRGYGHFTTRQNIQYNWVTLEDTPDILAELAKVEMHAIQTSGNCIRNITSDAFAGVAADEYVDPRPICELLRQWSTLHPEFAHLPRKFKFAINDSGEYTLSLVHSLDHAYTNESIKQKVMIELEINDRSFSDTIYKSGNINSWVTDTNQVGETIHIQYRNKTGIKHG